MLSSNISRENNSSCARSSIFREWETRISQAFLSFYVLKQFFYFFHAGIFWLEFHFFRFIVFVRPNEKWDLQWFWQSGSNFKIPFAYWCSHFLSEQKMQNDTSRKTFCGAHSKKAAEGKGSFRREPSKIC